MSIWRGDRIFALTEVLILVVAVTFFAIQLPSLVDVKLSHLVPGSANPSEVSAMRDFGIGLIRISLVLFIFESLWLWSLWMSKRWAFGGLMFSVLVGGAVQIIAIALIAPINNVGLVFIVAINVARIAYCCIRLSNKVGPPLK